MLNVKRHKYHGVKGIDNYNVQACNPSIQEVKAGCSEASHPQIHIEFKTSLNYTRPCVKINKKLKNGSVKMRPSSWEMCTCLGVYVCVTGLRKNGKMLGVVASKSNTVALNLCLFIFMCMGFVLLLFAYMYA